MNNKKKIVFLSIIILLIIIPISFKIRTKYTIYQANKNLDMGEIKLLNTIEDMQDILNQKFKRNPVVRGAAGYLNKEDEIEIIFEGFPKSPSRRVEITDISTKNPKYSFYNIHVGDNINNAYEILEKNGFKRTDAAGIYTKDRIRVILYNKDLKIEQIRILLSVKYKRGLILD